MARTRIRVQAAGKGTALRINSSGGQTFNESQTTSYHRCIDEFGVRNGALLVDHCSVAGSSNGTFPPAGFPRWIYSSWMPGYLCNPTVTSIGHMSVPGLLSNSDAAVRVLAATNPSKPVVDIPISIIELRDLPDLVRKFGRNILRNIADGNLRYQFGVKPMVSDFMKLLDFTEEIDKKQRILEGFGKGPQVRKATIFNGSISEEPGNSVTLHSQASMVVNGRRTHVVTTAHQWGYVTWTPQVPDFAKKYLHDKASARALARKIALGLTLDASTAWELLPWSWLVDWFGNMGDWIASKRSLIPVYPDIPAICTTLRTTETWINTTATAPIPPGTWTWQRTRVTKTRSKSSAFFPSAAMPLLTGRQSGILTSLAVLRSR